MAGIKAVAFDAGETLFDESRLWSEWADWLRVPRLTFMALLGWVIARQKDHSEVFEIVRPGIDVDAELAARIEAGHRVGFEPDDLYDDALPALRSLQQEGYAITVAGNQPAGAAAWLSDPDYGVDLVTTSEELGAPKPDVRFFINLAAELELPPERIVYVGDRIDNDVRPAERAGMTAVFLRRGPWAYIQESDATPPWHAIDSLEQLPGLLSRLEAR